MPEPSRSLATPVLCTGSFEAGCCCSLPLSRHGPVVFEGTFTALPGTLGSTFWEGEASRTLTLARGAELAWPCGSLSHSECQCTPLVAIWRWAGQARRGRTAARTLHRQATRRCRASRSAAPSVGNEQLARGTLLSCRGPARKPTPSLSELPAPPACLSERGRRSHASGA